MVLLKKSLDIQKTKIVQIHHLNLDICAPWHVSASKFKRAFVLFYLEEEFIIYPLRHKITRICMNNHLIP